MNRAFSRILDRKFLASLCAVILIAAMLAIFTAQQGRTVPNDLGGSASCTTDASGYCTVTHGLGAVPAEIQATPSTPDDTTIFGQVLADTPTSTTFRARALSATGTALNSVPISFYWHVWSVGGVNGAIPTYVATGVAKNPNASSLATTLPAGYVSGDLLVLDTFTAGPDTITQPVPSGWTQVTGSPVKAGFGEMWRYTKVAGSSETAPTVTFSSANTVMAHISAIRNTSGVDTSASAADANIDTNGVATPNLTVFANDVIFAGTFERVAGTPNPAITPDADYSELIESATNQSSGSGGSMSFNSRGPLAAGTYGADVFLPSVAARDGVIVTALKAS